MGKVDDLLAWAIPRRCVLCNGASGRLGVCTPCAGDLPWLDAAGRVVAALAYEYPVDRMVAAAKFRGQLHFALALGELLAVAVARAGCAAPDLLVPVPLHRRRLGERGYNQALEIGRPVAERTGVRLEPALCERVRPTAEQSGLKAAERRRNLRGAFRVRGRCDGARIAIVDDVITTGSTAAALAQALRAAGAAQVEVWAAARSL